jgi:FkbM family methyltransferase
MVDCERLNLEKIDMARDVLRRAGIAGRAILDIANWREVLPRAAEGQPVTEIRLRKGVTVTARPETALWPHFSDIWYHRTYTKHCEIPANSVVVDVGANVGVFSLFASRVARLVYALEPSSANFSLLAANTNGSKNIVPLNLGCSAADGQASLDLSSDPVSFSLVTNGVSDRRETVDVVRLETLFERYKIGRCDFLKLDCEGCEFEVIMCSDQALFSRIDRIVMEYHNHLSKQFSHRDLVEKLTTLGFRSVVYNAKGTYGMIAAINTRRRSKAP